VRKTLFGYVSVVGDERRRDKMPKNCGADRYKSGEVINRFDLYSYWKKGRGDYHRRKKLLKIVGIRRRHSYGKVDGKKRPQSAPLRAQTHLNGTTVR